MLPDMKVFPSLSVLIQVLKELECVQHSMQIIHIKCGEDWDAFCTNNISTGRQGWMHGNIKCFPDGNWVELNLRWTWITDRFCVWQWPAVRSAFIQGYFLTQWQQVSIHFCVSSCIKQCSRDMLSQVQQRYLSCVKTSFAETNISRLLWLHSDSSIAQFHVKIPTFTACLLAELFVHHHFSTNWVCSCLI